MTGKYLAEKAAELKAQGYKEYYTSEDGVMQYWMKPSADPDADPDDMLVLSEEVKACQEHARLSREHPNNPYLPNIYDDHLEKDGRLYVGRTEYLIPINNIPGGPGGHIGHEARNFTNNVAAHLHTNNDEEDFAHACDLLESPSGDLEQVVHDIIGGLTRNLETDHPLVYDRRRQNMMFRKLLAPSGEYFYEAVFMNCFRSPEAHNGYLCKIFNANAPDTSKPKVGSSLRKHDMNKSNEQLILRVQSMRSEGYKVRYISEDRAFYYLTAPDDETQMIALSSDPVASEVFAEFCLEHKKNSWLPNVQNHYFEDDGVVHVTEFDRYKPLSELGKNGIHGDLSFKARNFTNLIAGHDPGRDLEIGSHKDVYDIFLMCYPELKRLGKQLSEKLSQYSDLGRNSLIYDRTRLNMMFDEKAAGEPHYIFMNCIRSVAKQVEYLDTRPKHPLSVKGDIQEEEKKSRFFRWARRSLLRLG